jgi:hypothetical protein
MGYDSVYVSYQMVKRIYIGGEKPDTENSCPAGPDILPGQNLKYFKVPYNHSSLPAKNPIIVIRTND